jgi:hypothetical protein
VLRRLSRISLLRVRPSHVSSGRCAARPSRGVSINGPLRGTWSCSDQTSMMPRGTRRSRGPSSYRYPEARTGTRHPRSCDSARTDAKQDVSEAAFSDTHLADDLRAQCAHIQRGSHSQLGRGDLVSTPRGEDSPGLDIGTLMSCMADNHIRRSVIEPGSVKDDVAGCLNYRPPDHIASAPRSCRRPTSPAPGRRPVRRGHTSWRLRCRAS